MAGLADFFWIFLVLGIGRARAGSFLTGLPLFDDSGDLSSMCLELEGGVAGGSILIFSADGLRLLGDGLGTGAFLGAGDLEREAGFDYSVFITVGSGDFLVGLLGRETGAVILETLVAINFFLGTGGSLIGAVILDTLVATN